MTNVEIDICNSAVIKLGAEPINSLDQNLKQARLCKERYPRIRNIVLRTHPWNFAVRRASLPQLASHTLAFGDERAYQLPIDCLRVWKLNKGACKYRIEGRILLTNDDIAEIFYVSSATPVSDFDEVFIEACASFLAADLCYSLTQSISLKSTLMSEYEYWVSQARSYTSQEQTPENFTADDFLNARVLGDIE